jgi:protease-4
MNHDQQEPTTHEDVSVLREKQRLQQLETLDTWIGGILTEERRSRRWKIFFRLVFAGFILFSMFNTFYFFYVAVPSQSESTSPHIGIVDVKGVIDIDQEANADRINEGLRQALEDKNTKAVVLNINSPGGSPVQSQRIYNEIRYLEGKYPDTPVIAWIGDIGASGAYYVASAAETVYAAPSSLVGSIGVINASFGLEGLIDKLGVERRVFTAGENKAFLDPYSDISDEQASFWRGVLSTTHSQFIRDVQAGRGDRLTKDNPDLFSGLVWTGEQAQALGLIDGVKTLEELSRELVGEVNLHDYTPHLSPLERLTKKMGPVVQAALGLSSDSLSPVRLELR